MREQKVKVINRLGLHARAAALLVRTASEFKSALRLTRADNAAWADAKSILSVLMLAASRGTELTLTAEGEDEAAAAAALAGLFAGGFGEDESAPRVRARLDEAARPVVRWQGLGVSEGIVIGRVLRMFGKSRSVYRVALAASETEREVRRLRAALRLARMQLLSIKQRAEHELGAERAYIFDAHLLMLRDSKLQADVENYIRRERVNAEWAVKVAADRILEVYAEIKDDYLRERGSDVEDVTQRLLAILSGEQRRPRALTEAAVIVAEDLHPSAAAELDFALTRALVTDAGGWTSHTAIIARGLGIPAVVGVHDLHRRARTGDLLIVDAQAGEVFLHPTPELIAQYETRAKNFVPRGQTTGREAEPLLTTDGAEVILRANIELPVEYAGVGKFGARGIGLYRSEFLLAQLGAFPDEEQQFETYCEIARLGGADGAAIRLFDLGGDKFVASQLTGAGKFLRFDAGAQNGGSGSDSEREVVTERNPSLGLRAIRLGLRYEEIMRTQMRAIWRASAHGNLRVVLPMVTDVGDVRRARAVWDDERAKLAAENIAVGTPQMGAMIEVPSAVLTAEFIAREVDFFSLGTNDLVQYLLAVDRNNDAVAEWYRSLHPCVLRSLDTVLTAAREAGIPAVICGEMAATPAYAVMLIGLGARELSMAPSAIPRVRRTLAQIPLAAMREVATYCLACATADETEDYVRTEFAARWAHLFDARNLPAAQTLPGANSNK